MSLCIGMAFSMNFATLMMYSFCIRKGTPTFRAGHEGALFFCIHGAGHSALSFATLAKEVKHFGTLVAFDFKGHGHSKIPSHPDDMSIDSLCTETIEVLKQVMDKYVDKNIIMVGHSMGGSVCARVTEILTNTEKEKRIVGCIIIDVVEGTALEALPFMNQILSDRPKYFESMESAVKWSIQSQTLRKVESARASIPPQLMEVEHKGKTKYTWKVNLKETEKHWVGWFKGLSSIFLGIKIPKILVTAEKERMDKELTIAQMQGKFKLTILHGVGHSVQEDDYKGTARMLYEFLKDFRIPMTLSEVGEKELVGIANFHPNLNQY